MSPLILAVGFLAQIFFFGRFLIQWALSEKAKKVLSPVIFWQFSIIGSFLLFVYGWLRDDFAILLGQVLSYYIYIWNLKVQNNWQKFYPILRYIILLTPLIAIIGLLADYQDTITRLFKNDGIPLHLLIWGSIGQIIFTFRFIYQWYYSQKLKESVLPLGFWAISIIGAFIILAYAVYRKDPVLMLGQGTGLFVYSRNLFILKKSNKLLTNIHHND
ncbi:MAG: lipid-A-disaccharide synthase N-terminal domain-containing protein [Bacteroidales bacterium]|nr:lipid-A-disaccharide synthase N-terminal domain-containing protein [Bacteroidales bacterium]